MKSKGNILIKIGLLLIAAALFLTAYNWYRSYEAAKFARQTADQLAKLVPESSENDPYSYPAENSEIPDYILNPEMAMPVRTINGIDYIGLLEIPELKLVLPVISEWNYSNLKLAPCRYKGSAYTCNLIIAAHNYSSHFGNLKKLRDGDRMIFTDVDGNKFIYEVVELEILKPTAVEEMENGDGDLTLFTCTIGGRSRVTVRCKMLDQDPR